MYICTIETLQIKGTASNVYPGRLQAHLALEGFLTTVVYEVATGVYEFLPLGVLLHELAQLITRINVQPKTLFENLHITQGNYMTSIITVWLLPVIPEQSENATAGIENRGG